MVTRKRLRSALTAIGLYIAAALLIGYLSRLAAQALERIAIESNRDAL